MSSMILKSDFWPRAGLALALAGVIIISSMVLVRYRNRDRAMTTTVAWALDTMRALPDSVVSPFCPPPDYKSGVDQFEAKVRSGEIPVDTVRSVYTDFTLAERDGKWTVEEAARLGRHLGVSGKVAVTDSSGAGEAN